MATTVERLEAVFHASGAAQVQREARKVEDAFDNVHHSANQSRNALGQFVAGAGGAGGGGGIPRLTSAMGDANTQFRFFSNAIGLLKWPAIITGANAAASAIVVLTGAVGGLAAGLAPLGGLLATIPQGLLGLGASIGTVVMGFGGIGDALKAYEKDSTSAASASNVLANAQRNLARAHRELTKAQEELAAARGAYAEDFEDAQLSVEAAVLAEEDAVAALQRAYNNLAKVQAKVTGSTTEITRVTDDFTGKVFEVARVTGEQVEASEDAGDAARNLRRAQLAVKQAIDAREDSEARLRDMEQKGVEGSDKVVSALERVANAQERVVDAQEAVQRSGAKTSASQDALKKALDALTPAGRRFVDFIRGELQPRMKELRDTAQGGLLPGAEAGLRSMLPLFPLLRDHIGNLAAIMGSFFDRGGQMVATWGDRFSAVFASNERIMVNLSDATLIFADALSKIMVTAIPLTEHMGKLIEKGATLFNQWSDRTLTPQFFERAIVVLDQVLAIVGNLGSAFGSVLRAARPLAELLMIDMVNGTQSLADKAEAAIPQMREWFLSLHEPIREAAGLVGDLVKMIFAIGEPADMTNLIRQIREEFVPALQALLSSVDDAFAPALITLISDTATAFGHLMEHGGALTLFVKAIGALVGGFNRLVEDVPGSGAVMSTFLATLAVGKVAMMVGKVTGLSKAFKLLNTATDAAKGMRGMKAATAGLAAAFPNLTKMIGYAKGAVFGLFKLVLAHPFIAIGAAVVGLAYLIYKNWDSIKEATAKVWGWITDRLSGFVRWIGGVPRSIGNALRTTWDFLYESTGRVVGWVRDRFEGVVSFLAGLPRRILNFAGGMFDPILSAFRSMLRPLSSLWNRTMGTLTFKVPDWIPGDLGGKEFGMPKFPEFHDGGVFKATGGSQQGLALLQTGERVLSRSQTQAYDGGITDAQLERILRRVLESAKPDVHVEQTFNEKVDPQHMSRELAWRIAS